MSERPSLQVVGLEDVDRAVHSWVDRTVDAHVQSSQGERKKVPVVFASGERFVTGRTRKGLRDKNGVLILPVISVRRTTVTPDPSMQALGTETPTLQFARRVDPKTNDLQNLQLMRTAAVRLPDPVVFDVHVIPFPDRSILGYELVVQCQYVTQVNQVIEKLFNRLNIQRSFLAPLDNGGYSPPTGVPFEERKELGRGYVVGFMDAELSDAGNFEEFTDQERIVRWRTTVRVPATLQLDPEGERPAAQVKRTSYTFSFGDETSGFVDDPRELELIFGSRR